MTTTMTKRRVCTQEADRFREDFSIAVTARAAATEYLEFEAAELSAADGKRRTFEAFVRFGKK